MTINTKPFLVPSPLKQKWGAFLAWIFDAIAFLSRTALPINDLMMRLVIAKVNLVSGILLATKWSTAVTLATNEYPISWLDPQTVALLGILVQLGGGLSLLLGFGTRFGALGLLILTVFTHVYYTALDLNVFWIALLLGYVLLGASRFSIDHLLFYGLKRSPLPFTDFLTQFFETTRSFFTQGYLFALRVWVLMTFLSVDQGVTSGASEKFGAFATWLPIHSASLLFGKATLVMAILLGAGCLTRVVAALGIGLVLTDTMMSQVSYPLYWMFVMSILITSGPGRLSVDELIMGLIRKRYPQVSGKPAFDLEGLPRVVIIGAGFAGVACARALRHAPVQVTLIDQHNYHLFQPLLYQVATASLSPGDIAVPIRAMFGEQFNAEVLLSKVERIDTQRQEVYGGNVSLPYDYLVIATGATHSYFGKDEWSAFAPGLKKVDDATSIRRRILEAFELAEIAHTQEERERLLNFVIVGGGPTGVELAGAIAELARFGMEKDFRHFDPGLAKVILVQSAPRILPTFPEGLSEVARHSLESMGVDVLLNSRVEQIDAEGVLVNGIRIYAKSVFWAAGVTASPAAKWLGVEADNAGRIKVESDLTVPGFSNVFAIGDTAAANCWEGRPVPGLAPAAKQAGVYAAGNITSKLYNKTPQPFVYHHAGSLATIGRKAAVADLGFMKASGAAAWWFWGFIHVFFLFGAQSRLKVIMNWIWSYFTFRATARLMTGTDEKSPPPPPNA